MSVSEHKTRIRALAAALIAGEQSGAPRALDFAAFKAQMRAEYAHINRLTPEPTGKTAAKS